MADEINPPPADPGIPRRDENPKEPDERETPFNRAGEVVHNPVTTERDISLPAAPVSPPPRSFLEASGYRLTVYTLIGLFIIIGAVLVILWDGPACGTCAKQGDEHNARQVIADCLDPKLTGDDYAKKCPAYKVELAKLALAQPDAAAFREFWKSMFDKVVGTTLFPIITALLGYLFATSGRSAGSKSNES